MYLQWHGYSRMIADFDPWEIAMEFELSLTLRENGIELMPPAKWAAQIESKSFRAISGPEPGAGESNIACRPKSWSNKSPGCPTDNACVRIVARHASCRMSIRSTIAVCLVRLPCGCPGGEPVPAALNVRSPTMANADVGFRPSWCSSKVN